MKYFSDQEKGSKTRDKEYIPPNVWGGIVAIIQGQVSSGAFGEHFPEICPDGAGPIGTDERAFKLAITAEIPDIQWPLKTTRSDGDGWGAQEKPFSPDYLTVLDLIQFCYEHVAKPIQGSYHSYFQHHHLSFDKKAGQIEFLQKVNRIFGRNGISYELKETGNIIRLAPPILDDVLHSAKFQTKDSTINKMLEEARLKFLNPDVAIRRESLERLWDAWERIKSVNNPTNKKTSVSELLDNCASEPKFRELLETDARSVTNIGNSFQIRHSEVNQTPIERSGHIDYLFHRLIGLILLVIKEMS